MNSIVFASCFGTIIEWYDFLIYATAATLVFNKAFFPTFDPLAGTLAVLWWTTAYAFATSSLLEIGENERFRSELGPVPTVVAVVEVTTVVRAVWWRTGRRRTGSTPPSTPAATAAP